MSKYKVCVDIGGTKTIISLIDKKFRLHRTRYISTPKDRNELIDLLDTIKEFEGQSDTLNIAIAGRTDKRGRILLLPNVNLNSGFNVKSFFKGSFKHVSVENDAVCAALKGVHDKKIRNGLLVTWGTGIGGAVVIDGKVFLGTGTAGEIGHVYFENGDIENRIGGKAIKKRFGIDGKKMQELAEKKDRKALNMFSIIGEEFGEFLRSMVYILDPEDVVVIGSFARSWRFMKKYVYDVLNKGLVRSHVRIHVVTDKFYTIKGSYLLDQSERQFIRSR